MRRRLLILMACAAAWACLPRVGPALDAGEEYPGDGGLDAGCGGPADCASGVCAAGHCAAVFDPCAPRFAGCGNNTDWLDATGASNAVAIAFPAGGETSYAPRCVRIRLGQQVRFQGSFDSHPLDQGCGPVAGGIPFTSGGSSLTLTFDTALGTYGYYCHNHGSPSGSGMAGAIQVVQ